jgi:hypothetical protein
MHGEPDTESDARELGVPVSGRAFTPVAQVARHSKGRPLSNGPLPYPARDVRPAADADLARHVLPKPVILPTCIHVHCRAPQGAVNTA